jgi:hypothetical protein
LVKTIDNEIVVKKFKVLINWMECFINRWIWLMSLSDIRKMKETISETNAKLTQNNNNNNSSSNNTSNANATVSSAAVAASTTSPASNELAPSPASSVGSSIGSNNGTAANSQNNNNNNNNNNNSSSQSNTNNNNNNNNNNMSSSLNHAELTKKLLSTYESYYKISEYNLRSQTIWESNEHLINEVKYLNGKLFFEIKF